MTKNIIEQINQVKEKYKPVKENAWQKYIKAIDKEKKELSNIFNMEGKFICVDNEKYLYVNEQFNHKNISDGEPIIVLRGQGFRYLITAYNDATYMDWDQYFSHEFKVKDIEREITKIKEITKEEYNNAFDNMMEQIKKEHHRYTNNINIE